MRTKTLLLTAALAAAGIATSMAQTTYSVNAVGFVNVTLNPGYNLFCNPLNSTNNSINSLLNALPNGTVLLTWNSAIQDYNTDTFFGPGLGWFNGDGDPSTSTLPPGVGGFIQVASPTNIVFVGEVMQGSLTNTIPPGYQIVASLVPQAGTPTQLLMTNVSNGSQLLQFNTGLQDYLTFSRIAGAWYNEDGDPAEPTINVGEAFFFSSGATTLWTRTFSVNN